MQLLVLLHMLTTKKCHWEESQILLWQNLKANEWFRLPLQLHPNCNEKKAKCSSKSGVFFNFFLLSIHFNSYFYCFYSTFTFVVFGDHWPSLRKSIRATNKFGFSSRLTSFVFPKHCQFYFSWLESIRSLEKSFTLTGRQDHSLRCHQKNLSK